MTIKSLRPKAKTLRAGASGAIAVLAPRVVGREVPLSAIELRLDPAMRQRHQRDEDVDRLGCDHHG